MTGKIKHQYLVRLIGTALVFVYIPFLVYFSVTLPRSYNELLAAREEHFEELTRLFSLSFENQVAASYAAAMDLSVDTRNSRSPSFILSSPLFKQNPYFYLECIRAVEEFNRTRNQNFSIYFPATDSLFNQRFKYTSKSYINDSLAIYETMEIQKILDFFNNSRDTINFYSTFPAMGERGQFLLGIPVRLGMIREEALVFINFNRDSIDISGLYPGSEGIQFLVFDTLSMELIYSAGDFFPIDLVEVINLTETSNQFIQTGGIRYRLFSIQGTFGNTFVSIMPFDRITARTSAFVSAMIRIGVATGVLLLLFLGFMVYINYKPIGHLADEMSERNLLVLDLLLGNLLHGLPIPPKEAESLGLWSSSIKLTVITIFEHKFNSEESRILSSSLYERFTITCYITDILYQDHAVIICLLPHENTESLENYLKTFIPLPGSFEIGPVVFSLEEVKNSYWACIEKRNNKETSYQNENFKKQDQSYLSMEKAKIFRDNLIQYVEEHFHNPQLSQVSVADHFGISIYSLSRLFNNDIGIGFAKFITAKRMEAAKTLLISSNKDISEIAKTVGLVNTNYFSRLFKSYYGIIPSDYRTKNASQK